MPACRLPAGRQGRQGKMEPSLRTERSELSEASSAQPILEEKMLEESPLVQY